MGGTITTAAAGSVGAIATTTQPGGVQVMAAQNVADAAYISFHRAGAFATYFGIDTDNQLKVGGWSHAGVAYKIWHDGNFDVARTWTKVQGYPEVAVLPFGAGGNTFWDAALQPVGALTLVGGNTTLYPVNTVVGRVYTLRVQQDTTTRSIAWATGAANAFKWAGGPANVPVISPGAGAVDRFTFVARPSDVLEEIGRSQGIG